MTKEKILALNLEETLAALRTSTAGLTPVEAKERLSQYGFNLLAKDVSSGPRILLNQVKSSLVYLLFIAGLISFWLKEYSDTIVIMIILLINTSFSFYQEYKSEKIIKKLSEFIKKEVLVKRSGRIEVEDRVKIVPGDLIVLREGDVVPADLKLIEAENFEVNESQLTGESEPVAKTVINQAVINSDKKNQDNLVFTGSIVEKGVGVGVVYAIGKETCLGKIADLSALTKKETLYEKSIQTFSLFLIRVVLVGLALIFILKLILEPNLTDFSLLLIFIIALAVAVVPEALPVITTVVLAQGALKLAKKHVVVKRLTSLEDFGNVDLLCTDKTGTITENNMTIIKIVSNDKELFQKFAFAGITSNNIRHRKTSDSFDRAFINFIPEQIQAAAKNYQVVKEQPFDPNARRRRLIIEDRDKKIYFLIVIGAPDSLWPISKKLETEKDLETIKVEGKKGLRHLGLAYKEVDFDGNFDLIKNENDLIFLGYVTLVDPLRPSAKVTIERARKLGVEIKILTGDRQEVASYIGQEVNLIRPDGKVYTGDELSQLSPGDFKKIVSTENIFAQVSPEQKYRIIKTLKEDHVVAYQGDGINDAPSLKLADVAIAVDTATDVAKENADIILLNRNLEVVINGIKSGRSIFTNINKYIKYTMVGNFGNFLALASLYLTSTVLPLLPTQILLTSVITDIPLISISSDTVAEKEIVKPERHNPRELILLSLLLGVPTALFEIFYFVFIQNQTIIFEQTSLYVFLTFVQLVVFFSIRHNDYFWRAKKPALVLILLFLTAAIFSLGIIYLPLSQHLFSFTALSFSTIASIFGLTLIYFLVLDSLKVWYYHNLGGKFFSKLNKN
ncbi:MAG: cation-transporting P-type ATPase [Patescibacteria group bacterium]|nr:cation-transporting P-type ATPase [Patescibacteria group bacterium]